jgi:hypothetical protein
MNGPNGFELSGPTRTLSFEIAELGGSALANLQGAGSSEALLSSFVVPGLGTGEYPVLGLTRIGDASMLPDSHLLDSWNRVRTPWQVITDPLQHLSFLAGTRIDVLALSIQKRVYDWFVLCQLIDCVGIEVGRLLLAHFCILRWILASANILAGQSMTPQTSTPHSPSIQ